VDLGTCNWNADANRPGVFYTTYIRTTAKASGAIFAVPYSWRNTGVPPAASLANYDKVISLYPSYGSGYVYIVDTAKASMTPTEFKTAMNGIFAVYELATPTTESATPYTDPMIVNDWGTEEFVDTRTVPVPVGHNSLYLTDMRKKLEELPIIPPPSSTGTYVLVCTVASGKPTYSWESYTTTRSVKSEPQEEEKEEETKEEEQR
jgi:hypothetical protein